ncbi:DMT family transporter [Paracoccus sp. 11-3]|uniref:DMT family transporter n=1 Tax=Paracoccus amoyensis TaxID=2760093 RepID=A0A926GAN7_9RHOB|nr:DMT family transporter [Paracoccus amoyensis]MBC9246456.1 DMT family transporter [Paracoccus amoyensis]
MTTATIPEQGTQPLKAAIWMMGAVTAFTLMAIAGRAVALELDTFELLGYRSAIGIVIMGALITLRGKWGTINFRHPGLHLWRNTIHFAAQNLWFYAMFNIALAQVFALEFTAPLWLLILSRVLLGEKLTRPRTVAALCGFAGILLVAQPGAVPITPGLVAGALCAVGFALTYIATKQLTAVTSPTNILWWMTVLQTLFGLICAGIDGDIALPSAQALPWIGLLGFTGLAAHFCIASALKLAPATLVMPFDFLRLPVIAVVGLLLYNEPIGPWVIVGGALILGGNYLNIRAEAAKKKAEAVQP